MRRRILIVGGDAAGMSAASTARRGLGDAADVIVFERGTVTSYSACGIPYWVGGEVADRDDLVVRTPDEHRANGIDVRTRHEVVAMDAVAKRVLVRSPAGEEWEAYDDLVLATGAEPIRPDIPGVDAGSVFGVQSLDDGARVLHALGDVPAPTCAVVIGSGYIGLEMAEALVRRGLRTTVVDRADQPMRTLDPEMGELVARAMTATGIRLLMGHAVDEIVTRDGRVAGVRAGAHEIPADLVVLGLGVRARSDVARSAGLPTGPADAILTEPSQRVTGHPHVWAGGDCASSRHRLFDRPVHIPLGTHANKQGWVIGRNLAGHDAEFDGVVGTAITRICSREIARTGLGEADARDEGHDVVAAVVEGATRAGYYPGVGSLTVKLVADRADRRGPGAPIVGGEGAALRLHTLAPGGWTGKTVDDLVMCDLAYAPPFSPVWDPVQTAGRVLLGRM